MARKFPYKQVDSLYKTVNQVARELIRNSKYNDGEIERWYLCVVDQNCGKTYPNRFTISVPKWTLDKKGEDYFRYYVAHELAHMVAIKKFGEGGHGKTFMECFKNICPEELQHHEYGYKPRNAASAGVSKKKGV